MTKMISGLNLALLTISGLISVANKVQAEQPPETDSLVETISPTPLLPSSPPPYISISSSSSAPEPATTVVEWQAQIEAPLVQITDIRVEATGTGLQVVIEADGELASPTQSVSGNALVLQVPNASLGEQFQAFEPTEGIALVQATALPGDVVHVAITGSDAVPVVNISSEAAGLLLGVTPGIAQVGAEDDAIQLVVTGEEGSRYFEPNTATATRTDTPLRDIPQSIQVIPREVLEDQQVITLGDALRNVSGVVRGERIFNGEFFTIRGFSGATILRDGFRLNDGGRVGFSELSNLESVEVLKGPAAILTGSVQPGGVINLVSEQPLAEPRYEFGLRVGNQALIEPSLDLTGPITEDGRLRYRINASRRRGDSFRGYDTDLERFFIAPTISWQISDRTDLTLFLEYTEDERPGDNGLVAIGTGVANVPRDRVIGELDDISRQENLQVAYQFEHRFSDSWTLRNGLSYFRSDSSALVTATVAVAPNGDATLAPATDSSTRETLDVQTNIVGEFNTGSIEHTVLFGVDLLRTRLNNRDLRIGFTTPVVLNIFNPVYGTVPRPATQNLPIFALQDSQIDSLGVYIQDQIDILDNLILLAGVRYDTVEQTLINFPSVFNPNQSESTLNADAFTPRVGLVYQPIEAVSLYGSYSTSFSPNTATTVTGEVIEPERGEQFEVGVRAELLGGRLIANLAFFDITKQNVATPDPNPLNVGASVATGEQRSQGIELDVAGEVLPGWNIIANYAYTDATITSDNSGYDGNRLTGVPEHNLNLWTTYDIQAGPLEGLG